MIKGIKVRLYPTKEQEKLMWKSANIARFSYNWALDKCIARYKESRKSIKIGDLRKEMTVLRNSEGFEWLKEVSAEIPQQAIKDLGDGYDRFFKKQANKPKFKKKGKCEVSFFHLNNKFKVHGNRIKIEMIGWVKMNDEGRLPCGDYKKDKIKVTNPRIKHNGRYWCLSLGIEMQEPSIELSDESIGIDLGIKEMAIVSNIEKPFKNINKEKEMRRLNKKLKRFQRKVSRKYRANKQDGKFIKTNNILKLERNIKLIHKRIADIRLNHIHQTTNAIVKTKPCRIVVEDLNVKGMIKNRQLAKAIGQQGFNMFASILKYKCKWNGIEFVKADRWFPSSKTCSNCGSVKSNLLLKHRTFICDCCGIKMDRDKNASINLANYQLA